MTTDELIARHEAETNALMKRAPTVDEFTRHAKRQVKELIDHAKALEVEVEHWKHMTGAARQRLDDLTASPLGVGNDHAKLVANLRSFADRYDPVDYHGRYTDRGAASVLREAADVIDSFTSQGNPT